MKRGIYNKSGIRFGWVIVGHGGYIHSDMKPTRSELITEIEKNWGMKWRAIRRKYKLRIVFAKTEVIEQ